MVPLVMMGLWSSLLDFLRRLLGGAASEPEPEPEPEPEAPVAPSPGPAPGGGTGEPARRRWTVLLYMAGDNGRVFDSPYGKISLMAEMTSAGHVDLAEAQKVGSTDEVAILAQFDTITEGDRTYRLEIQRGGTTMDHVVETIDETNCGDPRTLTDFIVWGMNRRPAEHYLLVIWNHGMGWKDDDIYASVRSVSRATRPLMGTRARPVFRTTGQKIMALPDVETRGIAADDSSMDFLTNEELKRAIAAAEETTGQRLNVIGMDACLMAMAEVQYQLRDLADYMVASQEVEPMAGWPYTQIMGRLTAAPDMSPEDLSRMIVEEYLRSYPPPPTRSTPRVTQSAVRLPTMRETGQLLRAFVEAAQQDDGAARMALLDAKQSAFAFDDPEYIDLADFLDLFLQGYQGGNAEVAERARALRAHLEPGAGPVIANVAQGPGYAERAHGISIYFPARALSPFYETLDFVETRWIDLIRWVNRL
ncbi:MAG: hypothetical protein GXP39_12710 [Chloroflexi bacterium]|nr:hypothetical protein [Chloroflexota bacterium]